MNPISEPAERTVRGLKIPGVLWVFLLLALVYILSMATGVTFEDSGELITGASVLGVSHPPGYPLFSLSSHLFSLFSFGGDSAGTVNFASVFFGVIGLFMFFLFLRFAGADVWFASAVVLFLGFSRTFWDTSVVTEVYMLNFFFYSGLSLLFLAKIRKPEEFPGLGAGVGFDLGKIRRAFFAMAFLTGFAATNHQLILFIFPGFLYLFLRSGLWKRLKPGDYAVMALFLLAGLAVYVYLPIRAWSNPYLNWGDPDTLSRFMKVFSREQYGDVGLTFANASFYGRQFLIINPLYEFFGMPDFHLKIKAGYLLLYAASYIIAYLGFRKEINKTFKNFIIINAFFYSLFIVILTNTPQNKEFTLKVFFIPFWSSFAYLFLKGVQSILERFSAKSGAEALKPGLRNGVLLGFAILSLCLNFRHNNYRSYHYTADYSQNMLNTAPFDSILLTVKDNETFPLWQYQGARRIRPDLAIVNYVTLSEEWYYRHILRLYPGIDPGGDFDPSLTREQARTSLLERLLAANAVRRTILSANKEIPLPMNFGFVPFGSLYRVVNTNKFKAQPYFSRDYIFRYRGIDKPITKKDYDVMTLLTIQNYCILFSDTAMRLMQAREFGLSLEYFMRAVRFNQILDFEPNNFYNYYNIGLIYMNENRLDLVKQFWRKAVDAQPSAQAAEDIRKNLASLETSASKVSRAEEAYSRGDYRSAIRYYEQDLASGNDPSPARTLANIGDCWFNLEQISQAREYYTRALEKDPGYVNAYYNLGGCYLMAGDRPGALRIWRKGLSLDPGNRLLSQAIQRYGGNAGP